MNIVENLKAEKEKGMSLDNAVQWLCNAGASKVESIATLAKVFAIPIAEAKNVVHEHKAWSKVKRRDEKFHQDLTDKLD